MAAVAEREVPGLLDGMTVKQVLEFTPDQNSHAKCIESMGGREAMRKFGMSALWVSCWACLAGWMDSDHKDSHI